ncbi:MAG TPA: short-chain dehydrogenase [Bacteroidia bacterium]|nr:short-chain dehydrogenase [Bacteroidia bacterium]
MRKNLLSFLLLSTLSVLLTASCGRELTDAELLARDRAALADHLNSNKVLSYKFCKLILRSASMPGSEDAKTREFQAIATPLYARMLKVDRGGMAALGVSDYIGLYTDYLGLKDFVLETDEDEFPTLIEALNLSYHAGTEASTFRLTKEDKLLYQNVEHAGLSGLVMLSKDLGRSIALYECAETEPQFLPDGEAKTLLQFYRGFIFFQAGFYYISQEALTTNIDWLTAHVQSPLPFMQETFDLDQLNTAKAHIAFRGFNYLMRGFDRTMMEREIDEERALDDFEHFIADAKEVGLDNELVWVVEAYLHMKREEHEKAIVALKKLRVSPLLSEDERETIDETIAYLDDREAGKALNKVYDNVFMGKIVVTYMLAKLKDVDWQALMKEHNVPHTDEIFGTVANLQTTIQNIDRYTDTDTISKVGMEVGKDVVEGVEKESKNLWEKAKDLW